MVPSIANLSLSDAPDVPNALSSSLTLLNELFTFLSSPLPSTPPALLPILDVRNDLIGLTALLGKEATSLALAFKPPVSLSAAVGVAEKVEGLVRKLVFCMEGAGRDGALAKELNWRALEFIEAYRPFLQSLSDFAATSAKASAKKQATDREVILRLVGQVWSSVEAVKGISASELDAARKGWVTVRGLLDDCLEELGEEDEDEEDREAEKDPQRPTILLLLRLTRLLLHRLITLSSTVSFSPAFLPPAEKHIAKLSPLADELEDGETDELVEVIMELASLMEAECGEKEEKWFGMWKTQVGKVVERLKESEQ